MNAKLMKRQRAISLTPKLAKTKHKLESIPHYGNYKSAQRFLGSFGLAIVTYDWFMVALNTNDQ